MYINSEEYMKAIVGEQTVKQNIFRNTYDTRSRLNIPEPTLNSIDLYPEIFLTINPMVIKKCSQFMEKPTKDAITRIVDEIYEKTSNSKETRTNNNILRDLIQLLVLNQLLQK